MKKRYFVNHAYIDGDEEAVGYYLAADVDEEFKKLKDKNIEIEKLLGIVSAELGTMKAILRKMNGLERV